MKKLLFLLVLMITVVGTVSADYVLNVETLTSTPTDGQTVYFGNNPSVPSTTANRSPVAIPVSGTITKVEIYDYSGTAGSAESYTYYLRKNNVQDYLIATLTVSASERRFTNTTISVAVNAGDYFEIKRVQPTWATNPATNIVGGYVYIETTTPGYVLWGQGLTNTPGDNAINYFGTKPGAPITTAGRAKICVPSNGTVTAVNVREYSGTAGTGETYGYRIRKNTGTLEYVANLSTATNLRLFSNSSVNLAVTKTDYIEFSRVHPNWSTNPATNIVGATAFIDTTSNTYDLAGFPVHVQALTSTMGDGATTYFGNLPKAPIASAGVSKIYLPKSGTITRAEIYTYSGTAGTAESWSLYVRKNNTQDYWIATNAVSAAERRFTNTTLGIPITAGDYIEIKSVQPTWATNPATTIIGGYVWLEYGVQADTAAPASITGLNNDTTDVTTINWSWTNPQDQDFNGTMIYQNDVFLKNASKVETVDNWSGLTEWTAYTISTRTFDLTGNVNHTWVNKTETTFYSGMDPIDIISHTGLTTINDRLISTSIPEVRSQIIAEEVHTSITNSMPSPKGDQPSTIEYADEYGQNIIIKKIELIADDAKVGYWVAATRNGEEVHTHSPVWIVNSPFEVEDAETFNPRTNERTLTIREDPLEAAKHVLSDYVSRQPLGKAEGDDVLVVYTSGTSDGYASSSQYTNQTFQQCRSGSGWAFSNTATTGFAGLVSDIQTNTYGSFQRDFFWFNTSTISAGATIDSATFSVYTESRLVALGNLSYGITGISPDTGGGVTVSGDYQKAIDTKYSDSYIIPFNGGRTNWTLNSNGKTAINKTGWTHIVLRFKDDIDNTSTEVAWITGAPQYSRIRTQMAENTNDPFIEITYTPSAGADTTPPASITNLTNNTTTCEQINWTWTNPVDADYNGTMIWKNGTWLKNTTSTTVFDLWTGLTGGVAYTFSSRTFDNATVPNVNASFTNMTATPSSCAPVTNFTSNITSSAIYPLAVQFNDTSTGSPTTWNWSFGDGRYTNGTTRNATYQYAVAGKYTVTLTANNSAGSDSEIKTDYINLTSDNDDNLLVWMHMNGTAGSTTFTGEKGIAWTTMGAAKITTTTSVFGGSSGDFTGLKAYIYTPSTPLLNFSTGAGEIEMWVKPLSSFNGMPLIKRGNSAQTDGWGVYHSTSSATSDGWVFWMGDGTTGATNTFTLPLGNWSHLVLSADAAGNNKVYVNGTLVATKSGMTANYDTANPIYIGYRTVPARYFNGYLDEVRMSKSQRWLDNFTTPYAEYRGTLETIYPDINPNSTMRYKTDPDAPYPGAWISNGTAGGTRNRTIQLQNVTNTSYLVGEATFNPLYVMVNSVQLNLTYYPTGMTLISSEIDNTTGLVRFNVSKPTGFSPGTDRASIVDFTALYYNYSPPGIDSVYQYFGYGFLINGSTGHVYPVHNFIPTPVTYLDWIFEANFTANTTTPCVGDSVNFTSSFTGSYPNRWNWSFGDGEYNDGTNETILHSYATAGLKTVELTEYIWQNTSVTNVSTKTDYINVSDCTPPGSITDLNNTTTTCEEITWSWNAPKDADFDFVYALRNDTWYGNYSTSPTTWAGLIGGVEYTISTHTVDTSGNMNDTWVNMTAIPDACAVTPVADFSADNTTICQYQNVTFSDLSTNTPTAWYWLFGDAGTSFLQNPSYNWSTIGLFNISLKAGNAAGDNTTEKLNYINVTDCTPPDTIEKLTHTEDCYNITWDWIDPSDADFDHVMIYQNDTFLHNITAGVETDTWEGLSQNLSYTISTRTVDTSGNVDTDWVNHTVSTDTCVFAPVANFTGTPLNACLGENVTFTDTSTNSPTAWLWTFGDGTGNFAGQNQVHMFNSTGLFDISLKVGNVAGDNTTQKEDYINVTDCTVPAVASFTSNVTCGIVPFAVQFTDASIGGNITNWTWAFGDGNTSFDQHPVNNYTVVGIYTINFSVTNSIGTSWSNITNYMTARFPGDSCAGTNVTGEQFDHDKYVPNWFTSWLM